MVISSLVKFQGFVAFQFQSELKSFIPFSRNQIVTTK